MPGWKIHRGGASQCPTSCKSSWVILGSWHASGQRSKFSKCTKRPPHLPCRWKYELLLETSAYRLQRGVGILSRTMSLYLCCGSSSRVTVSRKKQTRRVQMGSCSQANEARVSVRAVIMLTQCSKDTSILKLSKLPSLPQEHKHWHAQAVLEHD